MLEIIRKKIIFRGEVQGVGFRFRARSAAEHFGATGWVRNEYDGTVSMEIQGTEAQIAEVIRAIRQGRWIEITDMEVRRIPVLENEYGFHTEWY